MVFTRERIAFWAMVAVLAIGANFLAANVALAGCPTSGQCFECVEGFCDDKGWGFIQAYWIEPEECEGECEVIGWFTCVCGV